MKKTILSLALGLLVAGGVISFGFRVSNDLRWMYLLGSGGLFLAGAVIGSGHGNKLTRWIFLCLPLSTVFTLLLFHSRNRPLSPLDASVVVGFWFASGLLGMLWRSNLRTASVWGTLVWLGFSAWFAGFHLPVAITHAQNRIQVTRAPAFALQNLDGSPIQPEEWNDKIVVLDFFSESCAPCIAEIPHLEEARRDLKRKDIVMYMVASDLGGDTPESIRAFMKKNGLGLKVAFDTGGKAHDAFNFVGVPALVVIDRDGNIRLTREGYNRAEAPRFRSELVRLISSL